MTHEGFLCQYLWEEPRPVGRVRMGPELCATEGGCGKLGVEEEELVDHGRVNVAFGQWV